MRTTAIPKSVTVTLGDSTMKCRQRDNFQNIAVLDSGLFCLLCSYGSYETGWILCPQRITFPMVYFPPHTQGNGWVMLAWILPGWINPQDVVRNIRQNKLDWWKFKIFKEKSKIWYREIITIGIKESCIVFLMQERTHLDCRDLKLATDSVST